MPSCGAARHLPPFRGKAKLDSVIFENLGIFLKKLYWDCANDCRTQSHGAENFRFSLQNAPESAIIPSNPKPDGLTSVRNRGVLERDRLKEGVANLFQNGMRRKNQYDKTA